MVAQLAPKATYRSMYGGTVIEMRTSDPKSRVAGVFIYARYVSVEFTKGIFLDDPNQVLEGSGKVRRHIKLHSRGDIRAKQCQALLNKASAHQRCLNPHSLSKRQSQPGKSKRNFSKRASTCHQIPPDRTTMTTSFDHQDQSGNRGPRTKYQYFFNQNPKVPTQRIRVVCSAQHQVGRRS